ncbi:hypothetical protein BaRGS_00001885 [Batillaria attramentaria]|uniref:Uncharacterized protein n=1 Tax=Batillaria attramentaria TaxID=370345 RepID=A0ABD0M533_9CAEN
MYKNKQQDKRNNVSVKTKYREDSCNVQADKPCKHRRKTDTQVKKIFFKLVSYPPFVLHHPDADKTVNAPAVPSTATKYFKRVAYLERLSRWKCENGSSKDTGKSDRRLKSFH